MISDITIGRRVPTERGIELHYNRISIKDRRLTWSQGCWRRLVLYLLLWYIVS